MSVLSYVCLGSTGPSIGGICHTILLKSLTTRLDYYEIEWLVIMSFALVRAKDWWPEDLDDNDDDDGGLSTGVCAASPQPPVLAFPFIGSLKISFDSSSFGYHIMMFFFLRWSEFQGFLEWKRKIMKWSSWIYLLGWCHHTLFGIPNKKFLFLIEPKGGTASLFVVVFCCCCLLLMTHNHNHQKLIQNVGIITRSKFQFNHLDSLILNGATLGRQQCSQRDQQMWHTN